MFVGCNANHGSSSSVYPLGVCRPAVSDVAVVVRVRVQMDVVGVDGRVGPARGVVSSSDRPRRMVRVFARAMRGGMVVRVGGCVCHAVARGAMVVCRDHRVSVRARRGKCAVVFRHLASPVVHRVVRGMVVDLPRLVIK